MERGMGGPSGGVGNVGRRRQLQSGGLGGGITSPRRGRLYRDIDADPSVEPMDWLRAVWSA
jgi:hypothetical protein